MDTGRAYELGARKVTERRRTERMGTVPLTEFSGHRALETGVGGSFLDGGFRLNVSPPLYMLDHGPTGQAGGGRKETVRRCCNSGLFVL